MKELERFLHETYGLTGTLRKLEGELDENFLFEGSFGRRIFKLMRANCDPAFITMQVEAHTYLAAQDITLNIPAPVEGLDGEVLFTVPTDRGDRLGWMIEFLPDTLMAQARPWTPQLCHSIGTQLAELGKVLEGFDHPLLERPLRWGLLQAGWIGEKLDLFSGAQKELIEAHTNWFEHHIPELEALPRSVIHNDANEMNIFVSGALSCARMTGLIDFGDMCRSARIGEPAIAAAYAMMDADDPLANAAAVLAGYNSKTPLKPLEIKYFFPLIQTRLAVSVTNSAERKLEDPDDPYLVLNEAPAWRLLQRFKHTDPEKLHAYFRVACSLDASPKSRAIYDWLKARSGSFAEVFPGTNLADAMKLELSFGSATAINTPEANDAAALNARIAEDMAYAGKTVAIGGWGEARPIYTGEAYKADAQSPLSPKRTHHLGVDISVPVGTPVHAPLGGTVWALGNAEDQLDYGGYIILEHETSDGISFYSLFGHLAPTGITHLSIGDQINAGDWIATIGDELENGGWWPHLHLQLMTETPPKVGTPPGACEPQFWEAAKQLNPNPALLLNVPEEATAWQAPAKQDQLDRRIKTSAANQKLTYQNPLQVSRGWKHFLYDQEGRTYIDAYNNVPHVGHANPAVIRAVTRQMELVSTNTRYIHESLMAYAEALTAKLPAALNKCFFTSSASEANELAIRIARKATGANDMLVMEHGYHGITTGAMAISPYKFTQKNGELQQEWVHVTPQPDPYRGKYADSPNTARDCVLDTQAVIDQALKKGRSIAGFISECLPSVGGQLVMPQGSLAAIYEAVRATGGLCIADDVQTSLGRLGKHFWGFEYQDVQPDILVLGKPLGNGHPLAAVITTDEIANKFADGPEFFTTFGGSTVSCAAGLAVLQQIETLDLQKNAYEIGEHLQNGFADLQSRYPIIGDVRGMGLFWGLDLVLNRSRRTPATKIADYVKNRLYDRGILIGTDGPFDNVLKIRPPMTFDHAAADTLLHTLDLILAEKPSQP